MSVFPDTTDLVTVNCPNSHPVTITVGQARRSQTVDCPMCSASVTIDGTDLQHGLADVDREWDRLQRSLKNFGK